MNREQAVTYLKFSGFSDEQIKAIEGAFTCEDCISRKAVLNTLENMDRALDEDRTVESYKDLLRECYKVLPSVKPKSECDHDHEILKAYSDGASAVLESLIEQYEHYLELLDADMKDGSATIVTKTKYAVYTEVVKQLKEVEDCPAYEKKTKRIPVDVLNHWIGAEVLDRIRNEMHATAEKHEDGVYYLRDEWVDEIIDKYAEEGKA